MESWFFLVRGRDPENIEKKKKTDKRKKLLKNKRNKRNEEYKENQITTVNIFGFTFYIKNFLWLENIVWKK